MPRSVARLLALLLCVAPAFADEPITLNVWPGKPPGQTKELPAEADQTKDTDKLIAGRRIIKLGNVSTPQLAVYLPPADKANETAVVICPGGGHHILAMDLEGTEVAEWLNKLGVTAIVLKYRVPAQDPKRRWFEAVQDAQRTMSIVRQRAKEWNINPNRIGICGFSAGGETAALTCLFDKLQYEAIDEIDKVPNKPNFAMLLYSGSLVPKGGTKLQDYIKVTKDAPPMFFAHAADDRVTPLSSLLLATELKKHGVSAELHLYAKGGHGYGLRKTDEPVTRWIEPAERWLRRMGYLGAERKPEAARGEVKPR